MYVCVAGVIISLREHRIEQRCFGVSNLLHPKYVGVLINKYLAEWRFEVNSQ